MCLKCFGMYNISSTLSLRMAWLPYTTKLSLSHTHTLALSLALSLTRSLSLARVLSLSLCVNIVDGNNRSTTKVETKPL